MKFHKAGLLALLLVLMAGWVNAVWADEDMDMDYPGGQKNDFIKERSYIGVLGISADIDQFGDFNGTNAFTFAGGTTVSGGVTYQGNPEVDLIPSITRQFGFGVLLGHREGPWAAELSFLRSDHTATFLSGGATLTSPASLQAISIDFKRYFFTQLPTQPFVNLGVSFPWLWVRNFSYITDQSIPPNILQTNDETISGIGLNLGIGMELYLDSNFSILGGLTQRWTEFDQINGAAKVPLNQMYFNGNPTDIGALAGNGLNIYVGTTFGVE